jgi:hypothetical protein
MNKTTTKSRTTKQAYISYSTTTPISVIEKKYNIKLSEDSNMPLGKYFEKKGFGIMTKILKRLEKINKKSAIREKSVKC